MIARAPSRPAVTVASYNIHSCLGTDGRRDPARVARVIREIDPDIIGLQEVDAGYWTAHGEDQLERLAGETGLQGVSGPTLKSSSGEYGNAVLSRWPVTEVRRFDLSLPGREPRGALDVTVQPAWGTVRMLVTHFGLRAAERFTQAGALIGLLEGERADIEVLAGDFNEWGPRRKTIRLLDARLGPSGAVRSWPSRFPLFALDRIWWQPRGAPVELRAHRSPAARRASDHLPVTARLRWAAAAGSIPAKQLFEPPPARLRGLRGVESGIC